MEKLKQIPEKYLALIVMLVWGGLILAFGLIRIEPVIDASNLGLDESSAKSLLLVWSIAEQVRTPVLTYALPDFRALFMAPAGIYWPGSVTAGKVITMLFTFFSIFMLYRWLSKNFDSETALIAGGLLLVSPLIIGQLDLIGGGLYMLLGFALGAWVDQRYRLKQRAFGGWYFVQLLLIAYSVTIHPVGLAHPLALAWHWLKNPVDPTHRRKVSIGIGIATVLALMYSQGWRDAVTWFNNPIDVLANATKNGMTMLGDPASTMLGLFLAIILFAVVLKNLRFLIQDTFGLMLLLCLLIGLLAADAVWAVCTVVLMISLATASLISLNSKIDVNNIVGQRGLVIAAAFITTTAFMILDSDHRIHLKSETLSNQDYLIERLMQEAENQDVTFAAASQWPARSFIATRRDVFPLPSGQEDSQAFLESLKGSPDITHIMFDQQDPSNQLLAKNIAELTGVTETIALQDAGVIVRIRDHIKPVEKERRAFPKQNESEDGSETNEAD